MPVISTNTAANSALRYLNLNSDQQSTSLSKLASGSRITKASDDAAGLAIGTRIQSDVTVLSQAATNATQGSSILQTADGGMARVADILQRMKSLATQSDSGSVTDDERTYINSEYSQLLDEINGIASSTRYNGTSLLNGQSDYSSNSKIATAEYSSANADATTAGNFVVSYTDAAGTATTLTYAVAAGDTLSDVAAQINADTSATGNNGKVAAYVQSDADGNQSLVIVANDAKATVAAGTSTVVFGTDTAGVALTAVDAGVDFMVGTSSSDTINVGIDSVSTDSLGISNTDVSTQTGAESAIAALDSAISKVSQARAEVGATMSRFEFRSETIDTSSENLQAAESAIMDADVASEKSKLSSADVKTQAAIAALTQANQMPQNLLSLLKS